MHHYLQTPHHHSYRAITHHHTPVPGFTSRALQHYKPQKSGHNHHSIESLKENANGEVRFMGPWPKHQEEIDKRICEEDVDHGTHLKKEIVVSWCTSYWFDTFDVVFCAAKFGAGTKEAESWEDDRRDGAEEKMDVAEDDRGVRFVFVNWRH